MQMNDGVPDATMTLRTKMRNNEWLRLKRDRKTISSFFNLCAYT